MTDSLGTQVGSTVKYLPFGLARVTIDIPTDKLFTGQRLDSTGLYYYNARYYDPTIGRFISPDTMIPNPANPQCYNRYSYCLNNPLIYIDPSGHIVTFDGTDIQKAIESRNYDALGKVGNSNTFKAFMKIKSVDNTLTSLLEDSPMIFNICEGELPVTVYDYGDHKDYAGLGGMTTYDANSKITNIVLNNNPHWDTIETRIKFSSHELVHAYCNLIDPSDRVLNSKFEENIGDLYSRYICDQLGVSYEDKLPSSLWYGQLNNSHTEVGPIYPTPNLGNGGTAGDSGIYMGQLLKTVPIYFKY